MSTTPATETVSAPEGEWITWNGGRCPVPPETVIYIRCRDAKEWGPLCAGMEFWRHINRRTDIIAYRVVKP